MEPSPKKRGRPLGKKADQPKGPTVHLVPEVDAQFTAHAKKLKLTKTKYASAAIAYFTENRLDPTKAAEQNFAHLLKTVSEEARSIQVQNVDISNRLISLICAWEKSLYMFLQQQQGGTLNYLEHIESDILRHQVAVKTNVLTPMVEMLLKNNIETYITRVLMERMNLRVSGEEQTAWAAANRKLNDDRDQKVAALVREFIKDHKVPAPTLAPKPEVPARPARVPVNPAPVTPAVSALPE